MKVILLPVQLREKYLYYFKLCQSKTVNKIVDSIPSMNKKCVYRLEMDEFSLDDLAYCIDKVHQIIIELIANNSIYISLTLLNHFHVFC